MMMVLGERDELFEVDEDQAEADAQAIFDVRIKYTLALLVVESRNSFSVWMELEISFELHS